MPITQLTVTQIVQQALGFFENRPANKGNFDPRMAFYQALDRFVQEKHYWWRRKVFSLNVAIGTEKYDLSDPLNANAPDLVEIEELFVVQGVPLWWPQCVPPELTAWEIIGSIYGGGIGPSVPYGGYLIVPGQFQELQFSISPQVAYQVAGTYWAVPMVTDFTEETIPLVPPNLHYGLTDMTCVEFAKLLTGEGDPRLEAWKASLDDFKLQAAKSKQFSSQEAIAMKSNAPAVHAGGRWRGADRWGRA